MLVGELIALLQECDPNAKVHMSVCEPYIYTVDSFEYGHDQIIFHTNPTEPE